jgi:hypothetical protein
MWWALMVLDFWLTLFFYVCRAITLNGKPTHVGRVIPMTGWMY